MKHRLLGNSGLRVSEAALGTMSFGEAGGDFIDSANFYTGGTSEKFVGEFIQGHRENRRSAG
jgi:aryl-alcohol dehydrogenase-like predicted oxidoreductase